MSETIRFLYSSILSKGEDPKVIQDILTKARHFNEINQITGILLFRNGEFLQLLEGDKFNVHYTFKRIRDDKRHYKIKVLHESPISERLFSGWSMAYKDEKSHIDFMNEEIEALVKSQGIKTNLDLSQVLSQFIYKKATA
jgi:hypothetical protein